MLPTTETTMTTTPTPLRTLVLGLVIAFGLSGCASERYQAQAKREKELAKKEGYVDYTPVGSNISIKVPKDVAKASEEETNKTQEIFRDIQRSTQQPETGPQSGVPGAQSGGGSK